MSLAKLTQVLERTKLAPFPHHSRIHRLRSFSKDCFVKREDELGFGVSGTKVRKYLSLLPALLEQQPEEAILIGSAYSNHVLSFSQLLKENGVEPILFLLGDEACKWQGNLLYSALISKNIHWISRGKWEAIDQIAADFAKTRKNAIVVPKGGNCAASLPGAMTLALDILRNEQENGITFDHLFVDSGTGLTACALLLALSYLQKPLFLHIVQIAGTSEEFARTLSLRKRDFETLLGESISSPTLFKLYPSPTAFGSVNAAIFNTIAELAQTEGFLTDPVFTAKLFDQGRKILAEEKLSGNILFLHSGGGLGLTGFQEQLTKVISGNRDKNEYPAAAE